VSIVSPDQTDLLIPPNSTRNYHTIIPSHESSSSSCTSSMKEHKHTEDLLIYQAILDEGQMLYVHTIFLYLV